MHVGSPWNLTYFAPDLFLSAKSKEQEHERHFRHSWKRPRGPFLGEAGALDFSSPEEAPGCRRSASRSARLSDAVLRSAIYSRYAESPGFRTPSRSEMDRRDRAVRRLRVRHP